MLLQGKHIFVVEDDPRNLAIIRTILRENGARVSFDQWGKTALDALLLQDVDIILLDLMFPRQVTGYDILAAIRDEPTLAHVPVLAVTASDPDVEMNKARERGFNGFLSKPIDRRKFPRYIAAALEGQEIWGDEDLD